MSIAGYLGRRNPERLMSGKQLREVLDEKSKENGSSGDAVARDEGGEAEFYKGVADYDPVLRSHYKL